MISKTGVHAVLALAALAELPPEGQYRGAAELAGKIGAPRNYLGKLLKALAAVGLVESQKGKRGGFRLARPGRSISLFDVVDPIDHLGRWNGCFLGRPQCLDASPCPVHGRWRRVRDQYVQFLRQTTIADLIPFKRGVERGG